MKKIILSAVAIFIAIQLIPYGKNHTNQKVLAEPKWDTPKTRELFMRSCGDCHSNETKWPFYSNIAPLSWSIYNHVDEGREHFNISMWGKQKKNEAKDAVEEIEEGEMPLAPYLLAHPEARLSDSDKKLLIQGLKNTFGEKTKEDEHEH